MRAVVQRVTAASVTVDGAEIGAISSGLCVFVGVGHDDTPAQADKLAEKIWNLRIFEDDRGGMGRSAADLGAEILVVSQFTLFGDTARGRRPSFVAAAPGEVAEPLVNAVIRRLRALGCTVAAGRFGADMSVALINDGPVTILLEV